MDCLGFIEHENSTYLVFNFHSLTLKNYLDKINSPRTKHGKDSEKTKLRLIKIISELVNVYEFLSNNQIFLPACEFYQIFIDKDYFPKIFYIPDTKYSENPQYIEDHLNSLLNLYTNLFKPLEIDSGMEPEDFYKELRKSIEKLH